MKKVEFKPCPFCGEDSKLGLNTFIFEPEEGSPVWEVRLVCKKCYADLTLYTEGTEQEGTLEASRRWNNTFHQEEEREKGEESLCLCPLCGGNPKTLKKKHWGGFLSMCYYKVFCEKCGLQVSDTSYVDKLLEERMNKKWNKRVRREK